MSKRVVDGDAIWISEKLQEVPEEFRAEYAWILPLAEANGCVEYNPAVIYRNCYAVLRPGWSIAKVEELFTALEQAKIVFRFKARYEPTDKERTWCFFVGMEKRLPSPSQAKDYKFNKSIVPLDALAAFLGEDPKVTLKGYQRVLLGIPWEPQVQDKDKEIGIGTGVGVGTGLGVGTGVGKEFIYLSNQLTGESKNLSPTENLSPDGEAKTRSTDAYASSEEEPDDTPSMCNNPQCPTPGDCAACFRRNLCISLSTQLGFKEIPVGWGDDAIPLMDKFTTKAEHQMLSALVMWAYGRPTDDFWREKTRNMKAFVTHVLKGSMLRQFNEAKLKPEFWTTQYYLSADEPPRGRCPFPHYINALLPCPDEMEAQLHTMLPSDGKGGLVMADK